MDKYEEDKLPIDTSLLFKAILENTKLAAVFIMNNEGTILRANPGALKHFGYSEKDVVGKNFSLLFTKEDKEMSSPEKELKSVLETGSGADNNYIVHKNGKRLWCHGESILARDEQGKNFIVKIVFDIDKQKRLEKSLSKINNDLSNFVYTTSHDLKAPINNIEALIETFTEHSEVAEKYADEISMMKESVKKFKHILKDLSEIGRVQEEGREDVSKIELKEILDEVTFLLKEEIKNGNAIISDDFSKAPELVYSRKNLRSIFQNLLSNAIKFRSPHRRLKIFLSSEQINDEYLLLKVEDNGIGIKEEDKKKVFSMYGRLQEDIAGTGVGMTIVARIVDFNEGKIEIESEVGNGTVFKIYIKIPDEEKVQE